MPGSNAWRTGCARSTERCARSAVTFDGGSGRVGGLFTGGEPFHLGGRTTEGLGAYDVDVRPTR